MKLSKISFIFNKAPFPATMTIISFALFVFLYWIFTANSIEPYYFGALIFAVPFVCFGITTFLVVIGKLRKVISNVIAVCLIFVLGLASTFTLIFMAIQQATTVTTDISKYDKVLKLTGYPNNQLIKYFPTKIPESAKNIEFSYCPGGENFNLKFETDSDSIINYSNKFSEKAKWTGKWSDNKIENNGIMDGTFGNDDYFILPEDFTMYLFDSKPYRQGDWNHGYLSVVAISKQRNEIIFHSEQW